MESMKFGMGLFDGMEDFRSWRKEMKTLLVQQKFHKALEDPETLLNSMADEQKVKLQESAYSIMIIYLANNMLRQIDGEDIALKVWRKCEELYLVMEET